MRNEDFPCIAGRVIAGATPVLLTDGAFLASAVVVVLTVLELLLLRIEIVLQLQWAFHVSAAV